MNQYSANEINSLAEKFTGKKLPKSDWDHNAHIIIAIWHNKKYEYEEALKLVRTKIIAFNEAVGTANTDTSGYHETLTVFWMTLTKNFIEENKELSVEATCNKFLNSRQARKAIVLEYYSRDLLFSAEARRNLVSGDIKKLTLTLLKK